MRDYKIIAALADIHIGNKNVPAPELKKQLKCHLFEVIDRFPVLDGIFILGDTLHSMLSLNSDYSNLFLWFADQVYKRARTRKAVVVWILGTASHDCSQLSNIYHLMNNDDGVDFRIYETVEEITLWDDYKVLILPDVKVKQLKDVDQYLTTPNKYDLILGHGTIEQTQFIMQESENMPTKTYIYDAKKLIKACKGPILFGHIHQYQHLDQHFYYVGPFTLLERGGTDAGFAVVGISDKDRSKFKVEHYINPDSAQYFDIRVTRKILKEVPLDEIITAIDEIQNDAKGNDLITLRITRGDETESADKVLILENRYRNDKRFSIVKKIKTAQEVKWESEQAERRAKYSYLMDENISVPEILYTYYTHEVQPTIPDKTSVAATIQEADFERVLKRGEQEPM